jgi:N-acetylglucosamine-6-phosphate deacetylase
VRGSRPLVLRAATVLSPDQRWEDGHVAVADAVITAAGPGRGPDDGAVDLGNRILVPGFVDIHVHGGGGHQVNGDDDDAVARAVRGVADFHVRHGTCALVATVSADAPDRLTATLSGVADAMRDAPSSARVLGSSLEGPWLAPSRAGAHDFEALRTPQLAEFRRYLDAAGGSLRALVIAPELPGALDVIRAAREAGVTVSVGHTEATFEQTRAAFRAGARHVTHLFNAMPGLHHRAPGPVGAALAEPAITVELIADNQHVDAAVLAIVGLAAPGRVVAVTDATAATGAVSRISRFNGVELVVEGMRVTRRDRPGVLAGSVLTMDAAVRTLVAAGWSLESAVTAATRTPADVIGEPTSGRLQPGARADLVVLDQDLTVAATIVGGTAAWDPSGLLPCSPDPLTP